MVDTSGWSTVAIRKRLKVKLGAIHGVTRQNPTRQVEIAVQRYIESMAEEPEIAEALDKLDKSRLASDA